MPENKNTSRPNIDLKIRQFRHEIETWKRSIEFMTTENVVLKDRLADVLNSISTDNEIISIAEQYQNRFVQQDEYIWLIRKEIAELDQLLLRANQPDDKLMNTIIQKQKKLSADMQNVARESNKMKFDFNNYLGDLL